MKITSNLITAILTIVIGVLFVALKGGVIGIAMTVLGVGLIVWAVLDIIDKNNTSGIIKLVAGIVVIVFGWTLASIVLYVMAALLLVYAIYQLYELVTNKVKDVVKFIEPGVMALIAILLLFNQGGTIAWVFIVAGIFLIVEGALALINCIKK
ncbi:MAG: DUF308 domain-containing protein [Clostridia bacterium]|nr:DUF308 domain-containing protein [Clostridia bacterium]MBR2448664.1 DUF308 domain-containing protein [Clostridia bacterium]